MARYAFALSGPEEPPAALGARLAAGLLALGYVERSAPAGDAAPRTLHHAGTLLTLAPERQPHRIALTPRASHLQVEIDVPWDALLLARERRRLEAHVQSASGGAPTSVVEGSRRTQASRGWVAAFTALLLVVAGAAALRPAKRWWSEWRYPRAGSLTEAHWPPPVAATLPAVELRAREGATVVSPAAFELATCSPSRRHLLVALGEPGPAAVIDLERRRVVPLPGVGVGAGFIDEQRLGWVRRGGAEGAPRVAELIDLSTGAATPLAFEGVPFDFVQGRLRSSVEDRRPRSHPGAPTQCRVLWREQAVDGGAVREYETACGGRRPIPAVYSPKDAWRAEPAEDGLLLADVGSGGYESFLTLGPDAAAIAFVDDRSLLVREERHLITYWVKGWERFAVKAPRPFSPTAVPLTLSGDALLTREGLLIGVADGAVVGRVAPLAPLCPGASANVVLGARGVARTDRAGALQFAAVDAGAGWELVVIDPEGGVEGSDAALAALETSAGDGAPPTTRRREGLMADWLR